MNSNDENNVTTIINDYKTTNLKGISKINNNQNDENKLEQEEPKQKKRGRPKIVKELGTVTDNVIKWKNF